MNQDIINLQISEVVVSEEACGEVLPPLPLENNFIFTSCQCLFRKLIKQIQDTQQPVNIMQCKHF